MDTPFPDNTENLSDQIFQEIRNFFHERTGNWLGEEKRYLVLHRLSSMVGEGRIYKSYQELHERVLADPYGEDAHKIITMLTTHYSYFFREAEPFAFFQKYLLRLQGRDKEIRLWSGACSSGEEVYSLAISAIMCMPGSYRQVKILGTDISRNSIEKARKGIYSKGVLKESMPKSLIEEFFLDKGDFLEVSPQLRQIVHFATVNLLDELPFHKKFHFIFLRNIFYYMNVENRYTLLEKTLPYLEKGGYLVTGQMDSAPVNQFKLRPQGNSIYRKL